METMQGAWTRKSLRWAIVLGSMAGVLAAVAAVSGAGAHAARLAASGRWWRLAVEQIGLHGITCADLAAAGIDVGNLDLAQLRVFAGRPQAAGGETPDAALEIPVRVAANGVCTTPGDGIEFWGAAVQPPVAQAAAPNPSLPSPLDAAGYWLALDAGHGQPMPRRPSAAGGAPLATVAQTTWWEENHYYRPSLPPSSFPPDSGSGTAHDHWFWDLLPAGSGAHTYPFVLDAAAAAADGAGAGGTLRMTLIGLAGSHALDVAVNDVRLGMLAWSGTALFTGELTIPPGVLRAGDNRVQLTPAAAGVVLLDRFALAYERPLHWMPETSLTAQLPPGAWRIMAAAGSQGPLTVLDVTDPRQPVEIAPACESGACSQEWGLAAAEPHVYALVGPMGRRRAALHPVRPLQWRTPQIGADYIVLTPAAFVGEAQRLAALRRAEGLRTAVVAVQEVYEEFGTGSADYGSTAIAAFLAYAYTHWQPPAPAFVLLLGDGTFDARGYCELSGACPEIVAAESPTQIPPLLAAVDPWMGETAADNRYAAFEPTTNLPSLAIGRLPAGSAAEAQRMIDAIVRYETTPAAPSGANVTPSNLHMLLVADNAYTAGGVPDAAGNFWRLSDATLAAAAAAAAQAGQSFTVERLYLNVCDPAQHPQCALPNPPYAAYASGAQLVRSLGAAIAAGGQDGALLVHYVGHGAIQSWAGEPPILRPDDVASLRAPGVQPIVIDMSCYTGYFVYPGLPSLAETWWAEGGAVAVVASSGLGLAEGHAVLDGALLEIIAGNPNIRLGAALLAAKRQAAAAGGPPEEIDTFTLFGDPALHLLPHTLEAIATAVPTLPPATTAPPATPLPPGPTLTPLPTLPPDPTLTPGPTTPAATPMSPPTPTLPVERGKDDLFLPWVAAHCVPDQAGRE